MKSVFAALLLLVSLNLSAPVHAAAADVLITALQTESATSASEEFIIVTNNSSGSIDITDWHLQYFSANSATFDTPSRNISLSGNLGPRDTFMAASSGYNADVADVSFGAGLAAAGGHVRLISGSAGNLQQHDLVGWGTAVHPETTAITVAPKGQIYARHIDANNDYVDTDNNGSDFDNGSPAATPPGSPSGDPSPAVQDPTSSSENSPKITELLPDPAAPATDASGEFVELYNPSQTTLDLAGYKLQTGSTYSYSYTFKEGSLTPGGYQAFYSSQTKLTLSNTSGQARLLDPNGDTVSETTIYGKAPTGSSWMVYNGSWIWTAAPTPGAVNTAAVQGQGATATSSKSTAAKTSKTTASKAKAAGANATKAKAAAAGTTAYGDYKNPASDNQSLPVSPLLLAVVGVPLIGYMVYEYRHDLGNLIAKFRRNRGRRREARAASSGR